MVEPIVAETDTSTDVVDEYDHYAFNVKLARQVKDKWIKDGYTGIKVEVVSRAGRYGLNSNIGCTGFPPRI